MNKYLVLLETSRNQRYIFSTNKLRENVGASELTYQIGAEFAKDLAKKTDGIEEIIATSGKALLLANDETIAKNFVKAVTLHALTKMPGLTINGAICEVKNNSDKTEAENFHQTVGDVHKRLEEIRYQIPSNLQRFQRIPFVAECDTSNLPAWEIAKYEPQPKRYSLVSITKAEKRNAGYKRIQEVLQGFDLIEPEDIEKQEWVAVIHADGNGVGETFLKFLEKTNPQDRNDYIEKYRNFSNALDDCTIAATRSALEEFKKSFLENQEKKAIRRGKPLTDDEKKLPIVPLVLGGDDLTIICNGVYAIKFTKDFLLEFERQAKTHKDINKITELGICAGIAIIKPHFPFHQAYKLAEQLLQSAKKTKSISTSLSAFDYHILYDSSGTTLEEIREKTPFVARPYVVTEKDVAKSYTDKPDEKTWIENHHFNQLETRVEAMNKTEDDDTKRKLPNSQMHILREGLFVADTTLDIQKEVDARAKLIAHRYEKEGFGRLFAKDKSLFFDAVLFDKIEDETETKRTHFLDALDIVEFWK